MAVFQRFTERRRNRHVVGSTRLLCGGDVAHGDCLFSVSLAIARCALRSLLALRAVARLHVLVLLVFLRFALCEGTFPIVAGSGGQSVGLFVPECLVCLMGCLV